MKKDYETCIIARLLPLKEERLKKWRERADFRATLRVVNNDGKEYDEADETSKDSSDEQIETIYNMDEFLDRVAPIIDSYGAVTKENYQVNQMYQKAKKQNAQLRERNK